MKNLMRTGWKNIDFHICSLKVDCFYDWLSNKGEGGEGMGAIIRERYLQKLIDRKENGMIKEITGN